MVKLITRSELPEANGVPAATRLARFCGAQSQSSSGRLLNKPGVGLQTRFSTDLAGIYLPDGALLLHFL